MSAKKSVTKYYDPSVDLLSEDLLSEDNLPEEMPPEETLPKVNQPNYYTRHNIPFCYTCEDIIATDFYGKKCCTRIDCPNK